jgi:hypothetical protein
MHNKMMPRLLLTILSITVFILGTSGNAFAWDDVGHKITAYIAWQQMTPAARENVIRILRAAPEDSQLAAFYMMYGPEPEATRKREYFQLVATWADIVRDRAFERRYKEYHHSNWHYDDTFWRQLPNGKPEIITGQEEGGQAIRRLSEFDKVIRDASASDEDKAIAIAWIAHLTGDIHQPLHTSARITDLELKGDQGGNLFLLSPKETPRADQLNLHWFWDSIVGRNYPLKGDTCDRDYVEALADGMIKKYPFAKMQNRLELGQYEQWKKESFAINPTDVFTPDLKRFEAPSMKYKRNAYRIAEQQLALAGYRLGETLNSVFGTAKMQ